MLWHSSWGHSQALSPLPQLVLLPFTPQPVPQNQTILLKKSKQTIKTNHKNTNVKNRKGVGASQTGNTVYLNLIDDLGGKWSTVLTAWRTVPSQLQSILDWQGKSWDFQHSVEGCLHFPFDECYREQILSASVFLSTEAENHFQTLLASHSKNRSE